MKHTKTLLGIVVSAIALIIAACHKEVSNDSPGSQNSQDMNDLVTSVVPDEANLVVSTPLIMSADFQKRSALLSAQGIGTMSTAKRPRGGGGTTDATPPTVSIISPANGSTVSGTVTVQVSASDNVGVTSVSFSVNGVVQSTLTTAPYTFYWNTTNVADGTHSLSATASDAKGNKSTSTISVAKKTDIIITDPVVLPASVSLVTPPVGDQGYAEQTCTPYATVYAARSIEQYYRTSATSYSTSTNIFSPEYVYNQSKATSDCFAGASVIATLDLMKTKGVCRWVTMPYTDGDCATQPTAAQDAEAANYKIGSYAKILSTDSVAIKTMLSKNHPVIINVSMDNSFINAGPGFLWSSFSGSGNLPHCMIICGYDNAKKAYKVMSSWGTSWGDAGYSWISYDFFPVRTGSYVYVMNY